MEFIILALLVGILILLICAFITIQDVRDTVDMMLWETPDEPVKTPDIPAETPEEPVDLSDVKEALTDAEIARIEREHAFDQRIAQIKEELALRTSPETRRGTEPVILHPHVHNLPHTAIPEFSDELPDVEITE